MTGRTTRAKLAAVVVLFFAGTFAGQLQHVLDSVRGKVDRGARITGEIRSTVSTLGDVVDGVTGDVYATTDLLRNEIAELQGKLSAGTATPAQVSQLRTLVERLKAGPPGPPGAAGSPGPPGPAAAPTAGATPSSTGPGGTTSTSRPAPAQTTTTTRARPTTTTTACLLGLLCR